MGIEIGQSTVLIVEDNPAVARLYIVTLDYPGSAFKPILTARPTEGLDYYRGHKADTHLVIVDRDLPEMLGEVVAEQIREISGRRDDPYILMVTGRGIEGETAFAKGVNRIVTKPFSPIALIDILTEANHSFQPPKP